jgi:hypothetical protein
MRLHRRGSPRHVPALLAKRQARHVERGLRRGDSFRPKPGSGEKVAILHAILYANVLVLMAVLFIHLGKANCRKTTLEKSFTEWPKPMIW